MKCVELKHKVTILEASKERKESHDFITKKLCLNVGYASQEDGQPLEVVRKDEEFPHRGTKEDINKNIAINENKYNLEDYPIERIWSRIYMRGISY